MTSVPDISATLRKLQWRLILREFLNSSARAALFFYAVIVLFNAVAWWLGVLRPNLAGLPYTLSWPFVAGALAGAALAFIKRPSLRRVAEIFDQRGGTKDRLLTAHEFTGKRSATELEIAAAAESANYVGTRDLRTLVPLGVPRELLWLAVPLATLAILWADGLRDMALLESRVAAATAETAGTVKQLETLAEQFQKHANESDKMRALSLRLKQASLQVRSEAEGGGEAKKTALRELAELEQLVKELRRPAMPTQEELKAVAGALAGDEKTKEAGKALEEGRLGDAAKKLKEAAADAEASARAEKEIQRALNHLAQKKDQLSKQMEQLRQQGGEAQSADRQQLMQQLSEMLNEMEKNGQLSRQQNSGGKNGPGKDQQQQAGGKQMTDQDLKKLLNALQRMKDQQQGEGGDPQQGEGPGEGESKPSDVTTFSFSESDKSDQPGTPNPEMPSGKPGQENEEGTTATPFGKPGEKPREPQRSEQASGSLAEGESLSTLVPSAAQGDAKATRRYKELTDAAASAAADAVTQENIPLGSRFLIRRYFEAIRAK